MAIYDVDYYDFDVWNHLPVASSWVEADSIEEATEKAQKHGASVETELGIPVYCYVQSPRE
ncbi:hypothetical protein A3A71_03015 [Candidatus Berkelbacteria bacterium RIFCSPLOWO2_01_FULL_50_28]|uniref:Uncharacterized protein n=1 Tax=Candidatus Berkelbacteria bacterium RIFCSPLOWO2_01_FULL_50_28 TaxID=1797471 RepID=A0A1F5ECA5_9BACT|nr:MAG: hypothetical protein A2807_02580 [Candidatus Berkelbacteria bacterium RIFCSPHIGHO2_01_FULL_50_36]OGD63255.1 MAG: hypothetical protein A3F39_01680 [Candidatus Berkelbacteria bacterium RIFCSPHIGHO2_12_FULL_50_11]OGD65037.1 MAG: hypothetical protein A3A71_03015 [Candidatus Berkelbacteria bacterium RIFCSPLOWO2_01_FULL_50_28]